MSDKYVTIIDTADGPVEVDKYNNTGVGAEYSSGGVTTMIPWAQVSRVRRVDREALRRYDEAEDRGGCDVSDEVRQAHADLDLDSADYDEVPRSEDPAPEGGRTTAEMSPPPGGVDVDDAKTDDAAGPDGDGVADGKGDEVDTKSSRAREHGGNPTTAEVREWAKQNGVEVSESGPVSRAATAAYNAAHSD